MESAAFGYKDSGQNENELGRERCRMRSRRGLMSSMQLLQLSAASAAEPRTCIQVWRRILSVRSRLIHVIRRLAGGLVGQRRALGSRAAVRGKSDDTRAQTCPLAVSHSSCRSTPRPSTVRTGHWLPRSIIHPAVLGPRRPRGARQSDRPAT